MLNIIVIREMQNKTTVKCCCTPSAAHWVITTSYQPSWTLQCSVSQNGILRHCVVESFGVCISGPYSRPAESESLLRLGLGNICIWTGVSSDADAQKGFKYHCCYGKYETRSLGKPNPVSLLLSHYLGWGRRMREAFVLKERKQFNYIQGHYLPTLPPPLPWFSLVTFT